MSRLPTHTRRRGFTLVEMLVVLGVIIILIGLIGPTTGQLLHGSNITQSGNAVGDQLGLARQSAMAANRKVQVRFYALPLPGAANPPPYNAMQSFRVELSGAATALNKLQVTATNVVFAGDTAHSPILANPSPSVKGTTTLAAYNNQACSYVGFQFLPDGSTDLGTTYPTGTNGWFLTLVDSTKTLPATGAPTNYYTLRVEPLTGHTRLFRP